MSPKDREVTSMPWCDIDVMFPKPFFSFSPDSAVVLFLNKGVPASSEGTCIVEAVCYNKTHLFIVWSWQEKIDMEQRNMALDFILNKVWH